VQPIRILAEQLCDVIDGEDGGNGRHDQAARLADTLAERQFHGRSSSSLWTGCSALAPLIGRSISNSASLHCTVSRASGEIGAGLRLATRGLGQIGHHAERAAGVRLMWSST
jgi:hypothetical protein